MRRNGDTKATLAAALRTCMQDTPIDRISIKTITDMCGLNRQTFYYHFKDIYDLVKWMYVHDINMALDESFKQGTEGSYSWEQPLRKLLKAFDDYRDCHLAIYNSRNYYPNLRQEILDGLTQKLEPIFAAEFKELGFDEVYREFLLRMYALIIIEYIERRARGTAFSTDEGFVQNWMRTVNKHYAGERAQAGL